MVSSPEVSVLHVINGLGTGGAERSLSELLPLLSSRGIRSTVVCLFRRMEGVQGEVEAAGWDVRFLEEQSWPRRAVELRRIMAEVKPDIVHTTLFESDILGRLASVGAGVTVVTSLVNVSYEPVRLKDPNVRRSKLRTLQLVDALTGRARNRGFHAISKAVAESNARRLRIPAERLTVVPRSRRGSEVAAHDASDEKRQTLRDSLGIPPGDLLVLAVGRQEYQKGHVHLVDAFSQIAFRHRSAWLVIAGREGNASRAVQAKATGWAGSERILILGHRADVPALLEAADVFAFPSLYEGLGGVLLEAMAVGLAIVGSDVPAIREVAGDAILFAPPGEVRGLGAQLERLLLNETLRDEMGAAARLRFYRWPTPDEVADQMAGWYRRYAR